MSRVPAADRRLFARAPDDRGGAMRDLLTGGEGYELGYKVGALAAYEAAARAVRDVLR